MGEDITGVEANKVLRVVIDMTGPVHEKVAKLFKKDLDDLLKKYREAMGALERPVKKSDGGGRKKGPTK